MLRAFFASAKTWMPFAVALIGLARDYIRYVQTKDRVEKVEQTRKVLFGIDHEDPIAVNDNMRKLLNNPEAGKDYTDPGETWQ